jgi:uncharacterized protein (UPF0261 family)
MNRTVAVLATLDTKGAEAEFLRQQIEALGGKALLDDLGAPISVVRRSRALAARRCPTCCAIRAAKPRSR